MDFPKRINAILTALNINQTGLAKELGVSRGIVSEFASGAREPSKEFMFGLSKLGISLDWFLTGDGPMFLQSPESSETDSKFATVANLPAEQDTSKWDTVSHLPTEKAPSKNETVSYLDTPPEPSEKIGRASCRERV
mgnify:CR=1 FL=1